MGFLVQTYLISHNIHPKAANLCNSKYFCRFSLSLGVGHFLGVCRNSQKISPLFNFLYTRTKELTFENFYLYRAYPQQIYIYIYIYICICIFFVYFFSLYYIFSPFNPTEKYPPPRGECTIFLGIFCFFFGVPARTRFLFCFGFGLIHVGTGPIWRPSKDTVREPRIQTKSTN